MSNFLYSRVRRRSRFAVRMLKAIRVRRFGHRQPHRIFILKRRRLRTAHQIATALYRGVPR